MEIVNFDFYVPRREKQRVDDTDCGELIQQSQMLWRRRELMKSDVFRVLEEPGVHGPR